MRSLEPMELGLMFWAKDDARQTLKEVKAYGVRAGQLGFPGDMLLDRKAEQWASALASSPDWCWAQCSIIPEGTRAERVSRTKSVANVAQKLNIDSVMCHIGFIPHDSHSLAYETIRDVARDICDHCGQHSQSFALETGQEPARVLMAFLNDVARPNLGINFDPANMILYGTGDPIEALGILAPKVLTVHCKDGDWPQAGVEGALGKEKALGAGAVGIPRFLAKLREIGYSGPLSIEREASDPARRMADIRSAIALIAKLKA